MGGQPSQSFGEAGPAPVLGGFMKRIIIILMFLTLFSSIAFSEITSKITQTFPDGQAKEVIYYNDNIEVAKEVYDVSGAGDTFVATLALAYVSGASLKEAAILANYASGIVVAKIGTATATIDELKKKLEDDGSS